MASATSVFICAILLLAAVECVQRGLHRRSSGEYGAGALHHHNHNYYAPVHQHQNGYDFGDVSKGHNSHEHANSHEEQEESQKDQEEESASHEHDHHDEDRHWTFRIGDDFGPFEYLNQQGEASGFHIDLMTAVCHKARKTCYYILDNKNNCWDTRHGSSHPGEGLMAHWYDACMGFLPTPDRLNSFNFTHAFSLNVKSSLYHMADKEMDLTDLKDKTIGFMRGWAPDQRCVSRQISLTNNAIGDYKSVIFETTEGMYRAVKEGQVDAILSVDVYDHSALGMKAGVDTFTCSRDGLSVMAPYGSELISWWNAAFDDMQTSGAFRDLCEQATKEHSAGQRFGIDCLL